MPQGKGLIMPRKYKAVKLSEQGELIDEKGNPIICPISGGNCHCRCAWYSAEDRIIRCQDTIIGAIRGRPIRSFRLSLGPQLYDPTEYQDIEPDRS